MEAAERILADGGHLHGRPVLPSDIDACDDLVPPVLSLWAQEQLLRSVSVSTRGRAWTAAGHRSYSAFRRRIKKNLRRVLRRKTVDTSNFSGIEPPLLCFALFPRARASTCCFRPLYLPGGQVLIPDQRPEVHRLALVITLESFSSQHGLKLLATHLEPFFVRRHPLEHLPIY